MPTPPLDNDILAAAVASVAAHGGITAAAAATGVPRTTLSHRMRLAAERGMCGTTPVMPGFAIKSVASRAADGSWIKQTKAHGAPFEAPAGHAVKGVSALVDGEGRTIQQWVKTARDAEAVQAAMAATVEALKAEIPRAVATKGPQHANADLLNQFTVTDAHMGMLAWGEETGGADYDLGIAERLLVDWFSAAIAMSPDAETAIFAQLGDLMHHDGLESVTPAHRHVLDADSRLQKIIRVVIRVVRQIIGMLAEKHKRVHVIMASANHDPASSAWMRELLHAMYEDEPRITVDNSASEYYAYQHGKTALFYHHGHRRKVAAVDAVFVGMFRELYGAAEHAYSHVGHLHSDAVVESNLMRNERHRTLAPPDAYAASGGWLSRRDAKVISYSKEWGEVSRITLSPRMVAGWSRAANDNTPQQKDVAA